MPSGHVIAHLALIATERHALIQAIGEWGEELQSVLAAAAESELTASPLERFSAMWSRVIASFDTRRPLWIASFEAFAQIERSPAVRRYMAEAFALGRAGLARHFQPAMGAQDAQATQAVGAFYQALMTGVMAQWLADPSRAPSGRDLGDALRVISAQTEAE